MIPVCADMGVASMVGVNCSIGIAFVAVGILGHMGGLELVTEALPFSDLSSSSSSSSVLDVSFDGVGLLLRVGLAIVTLVLDLAIVSLPDDADLVVAKDVSSKDVGSAPVVRVRCAGFWETVNALMGSCFPFTEETILAASVREDVVFVAFFFCSGIAEGDGGLESLNAGKSAGVGRACCC
jgi:hypothetical protein